MSKYIGTPVVSLSTDTVDVTGDITTTDATPEVIIVNDTHEDTDGGREGKVTFKGQQSGGEETTLAQIQASHDGASDDEKGDLIFKTNDGSDGASPTEAMRLTSDQKLGLGTASPEGNVHVRATIAEAYLQSDDGQLAQIVFGDASDSSRGRIYYDSSDNMVFATNNLVERARIASDGKVGIGTAAPLRQLHIHDTSANSEIAFTAATNGVSSILFGDGQTGTDVYKGYIQYNHASDALLLASSAATAAVINSGQVFEKYGNSASARIVPQSDDAGYLGEAAHRWQAVYATNGSIQTSDKNLKTEITNSALGLDFVKALRPVSYKWISGGKHFEYDEEDVRKENPTITDVAGKRNHYGLIAQEVKEVLGDTDFGGWVSEDVTDENATQSLRYDQFIAPLVKAVQELNAEVETLKTKVAALEGE